MEITTDTAIKQAEELATCNKCGKCCKLGSGFLIKADIVRITDYLQISEKELKKKYLDEESIFNKKMFKPKLKKRTFGECVFFEGNKCLRHKVKRLQCRTSSCNKYGEELNAWFIVNFIVDKDDPESIRQYRYYLESNSTIKGSSLQELVPDKEKLKKILNYEILR
jgi:Fe-S-cluster containining protein